MKHTLSALVLVMLLGRAMAQCTTYTITVGGGTFDAEIDWELVDGLGNTVALGVAQQMVTVCLPADCYTMYMYDTFGDGWNGATWVVRVQPANTVVGSGTLGAGSFGTAQVNLGGGCGGGNCTNYTLNVTGGSFPTEVSWNLMSGALIAASGGAPMSTVLCLDTGCYVMQLFDSWGDGWNGATWTLLNGGTTVGSGTLGSGSFGQAGIDLSPTTNCAVAGPVTASDCPDAVNICTNYSWTIDPNGIGALNEIPPLGSLGNPDLMAYDLVPSAWGSDNYGCLRNNELNSTWMAINVSSSGSLEFTFGGLGTQAGFYDWIMYPFTGTTCSAITSNTVAPVRCNWNGVSWGGTGLASAIPPGGDPTNFEPPLNVVAGEQYIICFSNWSSVSTTVPLEFGGTASVSCNPVVLPVELVHFTGEHIGSAVLLEWGTASESNSSHFVVHRGVDALDWTFIGSVAASGQAQTNTDYLLLDHHPLPLGAFYRLEAVDLDGSVSRSAMVRVDGTEPELAWPNPTDGPVVVMALNGLRVLDAQGREVPVGIEPAGSGMVRLNLPCGGVYTVQGSNGSSVSTQRVVVR